MKFRYFLRGFGVGIMFATLIVFAAYQINPNKVLTDEEIKARAIELGMVEKKTELSDLINSQDDKTEEAASKDAADETSEEQQTAGESKTDEEKKTEETKTTETQTTEKPSTEAPSTEKPSTEAPSTEKPTEAPSTEKPSTEAPSTEKPTEAADASDKSEYVDIEITKGMQSLAVCKLLEEKGVIDDAAKFDRYLDEHGYATKIAIGKVRVKKGESYQKLAKILTNQ